MKVNPQASIRVETVLGKIPVLYIEDFYADPELVRDQAIHAEYAVASAIYPGRHCILRSAEANQVVAILCGVLTRLGDSIYDPADVITDFSIVVARPDDLIAYQKHPHIDPTPALGIVYLNPVGGAGTSFYYNKFIGSAVIVTDEHRRRLEEFNATLARQYEPEGYDLTDNPCWQRIYRIEGRFNRLVVYPGNVFHAVDIQHIPEMFSMDTVRLTQRFVPRRCTAKRAVSS